MNHTKARPAPRFSDPGRRARYSYLTQDKSGAPMRAWHDLPQIGEGHQDVTKSLKGQTQL